jgi:hypothetical protein
MSSKIGDLIDLELAPHGLRALTDTTVFISDTATLLRTLGS